MFPKFYVYAPQHGANNYHYHCEVLRAEGSRVFYIGRLPGRSEQENRNDCPSYMFREPEWMEVSREHYYMVLNPDAYLFGSVNWREHPEFLQYLPKPPPPPKTNHRVGVPKGKLP